jgi:hypothetical protein
MSDPCPRLGTAPAPALRSPDPATAPARSPYVCPFATRPRPSRLRAASSGETPRCLNVGLVSLRFASIPGPSSAGLRMREPLISLVPRWRSRSSTRACRPCVDWDAPVLTEPPRRFFAPAPAPAPSAPPLPSASKSGARTSGGGRPVQTVHGAMRSTPRAAGGDAVRAALRPPGTGFGQCGPQIPAAHANGRRDADTGTTLSRPRLRSSGDPAIRR